MENLVEEKVKVKYNYSGFVPASIQIKDDFGQVHIIQIVPPPKNRWLIERNARIHGTFRSGATRDFDEFNFFLETFRFIEFHAIPSKNLGEKFQGNFTNIINAIEANHTKTKDYNSSCSDFNFFDSILSRKRREKGKSIMNIYDKNQRKSLRRKVSFSSPQSLHSYSSHKESRKQSKLNSPQEDQ
uniref:Uncharacterized protein n=1 Tax=Cucumis melo TaxID=3656 RepID=A0A9I9ED02_CUCME